MLWRDKNINRVVATKMILRELHSSPDTVQRFLEEGQITGQLEHPNIVPIYEMGVDAENLYFTMKYMKGETLKALLDRLKQDPGRCESWSLRRRLDIFQSVCHAIDYAHSKKVLHRDLKPANIMLGNFGEVMVMDWGLAKIMGQGQEVLSEDSVTTLRSEGGFKTITGQITGTPLYMAPEQAAGEIEKIDHLSDIYSLGVILYELVAGIHCVEGETVLNILTKVCQGKIHEVPVRGLFGPIPRELRCIIGKALQFKKEDRYQSARDLAEDVQKFLDGRKVKACRYTLWDKTKKLLYRFRKELALVTVTILILLPAFLLWHRFQSQKQLEEQAMRLVNEGENLLSGEDYQDALKALEQFSLAGEATDKLKKDGPRFKTEVMDRAPLPATETPGKKEKDAPPPPDQPPEERPEPAVTGSILLPPAPEDTTLKGNGDKEFLDPATGGISTGEEGNANRNRPSTGETPDTKKTPEDGEQKAQDLQRLRAENFARVKELLLTNIEKSRKAFQLTQKYEFKRNEADLWLAMYKAAGDAGEAGWQEIAGYQIKTLVTQEDYENIYVPRLK